LAILQRHNTEPQALRRVAEAIMAHPTIIDVSLFRDGLYYDYGVDPVAREPSNAAAFFTALSLVEQKLRSLKINQVIIIIVVIIIACNVFCYPLFF
jgi:hypothetical protein